VHDEAEVGLVETHPEREVATSALTLLSRSVLEPLALGGVGATGVGRDPMARPGRQRVATSSAAATVSV
jgi:hypothetical protein